MYLTDIFSRLVQLFTENPFIFNRNLPLDIYNSYLLNNSLSLFKLLTIKNKSTRKLLAENIIINLILKALTFNCHLSCVN